MNNIKNRRELHIENKIFTKDNLTDLIRLFINQSNEIEKKSREIKRQEFIQKGFPESIISEEYINSSHSEIALISADSSKYNFFIRRN